MIRYQNFSRLNLSGQPAPLATVTVYISGTGTLANLYVANTLAQPGPNPFTAGLDGYFECYAPNSRYDIQFSGGGISTPWSLGDILFYDPVDASIPGGRVLLTSALTGTQNNFSLNGAIGDVVVDCTNATPVTYTGIAGGLPGQRVTFRASGAGLVSFTANDPLSTPSARLQPYATSAPTSIIGGGTFSVYCTGAAWRCDAHEQGQCITPALNAANYLTNTTATWMVAALNAVTQKYHLRGRLLTIILEIDNAAVGGAPLPTMLRVLNGAWGGYTLAGPMNEPLAYTEESSTIILGGRVFGVGGGTELGLIKPAVAPWAPSGPLVSSSSNGTSVAGRFTVEVL